MYNIFRKGLILLILLIIVLGCKTTGDVSSPKEIVEYQIEDIFPNDRDLFLYLDIPKNWDLISLLSTDLELGKQEIKILEKSSKVFIGSGWKAEDGIDIYIDGDFSKKSFEFLLFLSLDWKKVQINKTRVWKSKNGLYLNIIDDNTILLSNRESRFLESNPLNYLIIPPGDSLYGLIPQMDNNILKELTKGFIKQGVQSIEVGANQLDGIYGVTGKLGFESNGKAKGFSLLLRLFLRGFLDKHEEEYIVEISRNLEYYIAENYILIDKINISEEKVIEILKKLIKNNGDADK
jgi:hypothetical protein